MIFKETSLQGNFVIEPELNIDHRGFFTRYFCAKEFSEHNIDHSFVQANHSGTKGIGSIRGLHFQKEPYSETKLVKCVKGKIYDVVVDLRQNSKTFLKWYGEILSEENKKMMLVPKGFAHGFQTLTEYSEITYFVSEYYNKDYEGIINYLDPKVGIEWILPIGNISAKDKDAQFINENFLFI